jgi:hypothetical protein
VHPRLSSDRVLGALLLLLVVVVIVVLLSLRSTLLDPLNCVQAFFLIVVEGEDKV